MNTQRLIKAIRVYKRNLNYTGKELIQILNLPTNIKFEVTDEDINNSWLDNSAEGAAGRILGIIAEEKYLNSLNVNNYSKNNVDNRYDFNFKVNDKIVMTVEFKSAKKESATFTMSEWEYKQHLIMSNGGKNTGPLYIFSETENIKDDEYFLDVINCVFFQDLIPFVKNSKFNDSYYLFKDNIKMFE